MAMTTSNSISVKARRGGLGFRKLARMTLSRHMVTELHGYTVTNRQPDVTMQPGNDVTNRGHCFTRTTSTRLTSTANCFPGGAFGIPLTYPAPITSLKDFGTRLFSKLNLRKA